MSLRLQRNHTLDVLHLEVIGLRVIGRSKLLDYRTFGKRHVVLVGRDYLVRILLCSLLDHLEEARFLLFAIDDEGAAEDFVTTVFRVDLCKTEHLAVCQLASQVGLHLLQVVHLLLAQRQSLLFVVRFQVFDVDNGFRLAVGGEHVLVQSFIHALQHGVELGILVGYGEVLLDACDAFQSHVLCDFHGVCTPWCNHLASWSYETSLQVLFTFGSGLTE